MGCVCVADVMRVVRDVDVLRWCWCHVTHMSQIRAG